MDKFVDGIADFLAEALARFKRWDKTRLLKEGKELSHYLARQLFNQIPGVSAVAALLVGGWVASTFNTSPSGRRWPGIC